jgi:hypothetical protein
VITPEDPFLCGTPFPRRTSDADDLRMAWRDACADLRLAYLAWKEASSADSADAFAVYRAAADREAAAAEVFVRRAASRAFMGRGADRFLTP